MSLSVQDKIDIKLKVEQSIKDNRESSGKWSPSLFGACYRRQWYNRSREPKTEPIDLRSLRVFRAGNLFHDFVQSFFDVKDKEKLIETPTTKGFADLVLKDEVVDIKSQHSKAFWYMTKSTDILKDKINNWLQVGWYAKQLEKERSRLVFVSKDDLCIQEYVLETEKLIPLVNDEENHLINLSKLPEGDPRLYNGKECDYCNWKTKCIADGNTKCKK